MKKKKKVSKEELKIKELNEKVFDLQHTLRSEIRDKEAMEKELNELRVFKKLNEGRIDHATHFLSDHVKNLMEIVRWQVKPSTASHPFEKAKEEKTEFEDKNGPFQSRPY